MLIEIIKVGVSAGGKDIPVGEQRETDEASAESLIRDGYAKKAVAENALKSSTTGEGTQGDKVPGQGGQAGEGGAAGGNGGANNGTGNQNTGEELAKVKKALDGKYKRDPLYEAALAAGVEIAFDTTKPKIIEAIIAQGKADALLK